MLTREQVARVLFANWMWEDGEGEVPAQWDWRDYERGDHLNPVGLNKSNFLETADAILASVNEAE